MSAVVISLSHKHLDVLTTSVCNVRDVRFGLIKCIDLKRTNGRRKERKKEIFQRGLLVSITTQVDWHVKFITED